MKLRIFSLIFLLGLSAKAAQADERYTFDRAHTHIQFSVKSLGVSRIMGDFTAYDGNFVFCLDPPDKNAISMVLYSAGIRTTDGTLEDELKGPHFFNAAQFPRIRFDSTSVKLIGTYDADVMGSLTLLGVTRPVKFKVHFEEKRFDEASGNYAISFTATGTIKRADFGMNYLSPVVGNEVQLYIEAQGVDDRKGGRLMDY